MTSDERHAKLQRILDEHDRIADQLRESDEALRAASRAQADYMEATAHYARAHAAMIADSTAANRKAIDAMIAANRAAMALYNEED